MVFWNTPGINADLMQVRDGRVCKVGGLVGSINSITNSGAVIPGDNNNTATNYKVAFGEGESYGGFPAPDDYTNS
jgi:hypothetical protein